MIFLMAALNRALPLEQVHDVAMRVAEDLNLDVPRRFDVRLDEQRAVAKGCQRFLPGCLQERGETPQPRGRCASPVHRRRPRP